MTNKHRPEVVLSSFKTERVLHKLTAAIQDNGDLKLEGYYDGRASEEAWGGDYDFSLTVPADHVPQLMLELLKDHFHEHFHVMADFRRWLDDREIPNDFRHWP